jgi:hypothetical protein
LLLFQKCLLARRDFLVAFYGVLSAGWYHANRDNLTPSIPNFIPFISFTFLRVQARNFSTILNKNGESRHSYLIPDFTGNCFHFFLLIMMLAIGSLYIAFIILRDIPSITFFSDFIMEGFWFFLHLLRLSYDYCFWLFLCAALHLLICICWTNFFMVHYLFNVLTNSVSKYFIKMFYIYVYEHRCVWCPYLRIRVILASLNDFAGISFHSVTWNNLRSIKINSSLKVW